MQIVIAMSDSWEGFKGGPVTEEGFARDARALIENTVDLYEQLKMIGFSHDESLHLSLGN
jgi:hypothetical protein